MSNENSIGIEHVDNSVPAFTVTMQQTPRQGGKTVAWQDYESRVRKLHDLGFEYWDKDWLFIHPNNGWKITAEKLNSMDTNHFVNWVRMYQRENRDASGYVSMSIRESNHEGVIARLAAMGKEVSGRG